MAPLLVLLSAPLYAGAGIRSLVGAGLYKPNTVSTLPVLLRKSGSRRLRLVGI